MLEQTFEANKNAKVPSDSMLEYVKNLSVDAEVDIYLYWNDRDFIYSVSELSNKYAPIILGGWTPRVVAHYKNGELIN